MNAKDELVEQIGETYGYINHLFDQKIEEYKLAAAEKSALLASKVITAIIMTILVVIMASFGLISLAFYLAGDMDSTARGFGFVAIIMLVMVFVVFFFRRLLIVNPSVAKTISIFFSEPEDKKDRE